MTVALLLAVAAACCAAAGLADTVAMSADRSRTRAPRRPLTALLTRLGRGVGMPGPPAGLRARLDAAGLDPRHTPADLMAVKSGAALIGAGLAAALLPSAPGRAGLALLAVLPAGAFALPDLELRRRARRRAHAIALELPDVLDLLRVAIDAGLPAPRALAEVGARCGGVLASELAQLAARVELGQPRDVALARLAARAPVPEVCALVAILRRAHRHGTPPSPALAALSADARSRRARAIRDDAARAAPKIQLVVALLLVPAVMLLVAAGLVQGLL